MSKKEKYLKLLQNNRRNIIDEEMLHATADEIIISLLEDLGYNEIVKEYKSQQEYFWYS